MFEKYKIRKLIDQILISPGRDNFPQLRALRDYGRPGLDALLELYKSKKIAHEEMEKYLNLYYDKSHLNTFIELLGDGREQIRTLAREIICSKGGQSVLPVLLERLKQSDIVQRRGLADIIKRLGSQSDIDKIAPLLNEKERDLKKTAINILMGIGGSKAATHIIELIKSPDWWARRRAVEALSKLKVSESAQPLLDQLDKERDPKIKIEIIKTLGEVGDAQSAKRILPQLKDGDMIVRQMVIEAMGKTADASIVGEVIELMKDAEVNVRRAGAEILDKVKDPRAIEILLKALKDNDWWVREIATDALADIKTGGINKKVIKLFKSEDENTRRSAVEYFNRSPDPMAFDSLIGVLRDKDWWVREKAVQTLGKIGDERAIEPILELVDDPEVRWVVPCALGEIGGDKAVMHLHDFLEDPERSIRLTALKGIGKIKSKASLPLIKAMVKDTDVEVRDTALEIIKEMTGHAVKANQIIAEQERGKWTGGSTVFSAFVPEDVKVIHEAILVLDLCNSTEMAAKYGDSHAMKLTGKLVGITKPLATQYHVRFTKSTGDGYLMTFNDIRHALGFSRKIMEALKKSNETAPENECIHVRIAINMGETRIDPKGDRLGIAVNMTFRVEGLKPEQLIEDKDGIKPEEMPLVNRVFITEHVNDELSNETKPATRFIGFFDLKGISGRHRIFQLITEEVKES
ncbi:MAG: hypothetical protein IEMM0002_1325 [bacterium]|nr:MAG: hypothetical protein IEMM0002_1325 [bacterium]